MDIGQHGWDTAPEAPLNGTNAKAVVITFDDGYADFYRYAFPILSEYGFSATVFVITGLMKPQRMSFKGTECLTLSEVRELHSQGISIGSHTVSHRDLRLLKQDEVENELSGSKKSLEDALGAPVKSFAYPFAFPEADRGFVSQAGRPAEQVWLRARRNHHPGDGPARRQSMVFAAIAGQLF